MEHLSDPDRMVMRRAGLVLAGIGALDVASCFVTVARGESYSSSLNIFALVAGILVYRGRPDAARFVVRGLSFLLGSLMLLPVLALVSILVLHSFLPPPALMWMQLKASPFETAAEFMLSVLLIALLVWVRSSLAALPLFSGGRPATPLHRSKATALGAMIPLMLAILLPVLWPRDVGNRVVEEARRKVGPGYSFYVRELNSGPGHGKAVVIAYSATEMREISVEWMDR